MVLLVRVGDNQLGEVAGPLLAERALSIRRLCVYHADGLSFAHLPRIQQDDVCRGEVVLPQVHDIAYAEVLPFYVLIHTSLSRLTSLFNISLIIYTSLLVVYEPIRFYSHLI